MFRNVENAPFVPPPPFTGVKQLTHCVVLFEKFCESTPIADHKAVSGLIYQSCWSPPALSHQFLISFVYYKVIALKTLKKSAW